MSAGRVHLAVIPTVTVDPPVTMRTLGLARRQRTEMHCVVCDRPASKHADTIEIGGEVFTPACELIHGSSMVPYGPPEPNVRSCIARLDVAGSMPLRIAKAIIGSLGRTSKMPGASYGLDAKLCLIGSELVKYPGSVCHGCYALKNFYATYYNALKARWTRQRAIAHPRWTEAMIAVLWDFVKRGGERFFRFHVGSQKAIIGTDSQIAAMRSRCSTLCRSPLSREYAIVAEWLKEGGVIPRNLTIRLSAHWIGRPPQFEQDELLGLPTSTVHEGEHPVMVSDRRADVVACRASTRDNQCGRCRACWSPKVRSVSYPLH